jgi:hypothetical protein
MPHYVLYEPTDALCSMSLNLQNVLLPARVISWVIKKKNRHPKRSKKKEERERNKPMLMLTVMWPWCYTVEYCHAMCM